MAKPIVLALNSLRGRSGKDTLMEQLMKVGYEVERVAFGDILKSTCADNLTTSRSLAALYEEGMHSDKKDVADRALAVANIPANAYRKFLEEVQGAALSTPRTLRWHLQQYGTEYRRNHLREPDVWLDAGLRQYQNILANKPCDIIVFTDMRQANEYDELTQLGAERIFLLREWIVEGVDDQPIHATDTELSSKAFDAVVVNRWGQPENMVYQLQDQGVLK